MAGYQALAHRPFVGRFFALDDFWILTDADRAHGLLGLFLPSNGWLQYRPLTTVGYFAAQRALFGLEPGGWQVVHLAGQATNGVLVWAVARRLLRSETGALACALVYAAAPGHTLAARWLALETVTGVVTVVLAALWLWLHLPPRARAPVLAPVTLVALLAGELSVTLAPALTLLFLLLEPAETRRRSRPALAAVWALLLAAAGAKLVWGRVVFPRVDPQGADVFWRHYALNLDPWVALDSLGRYVRAASPPLAALPEGEATARLFGATAVALALALIATVLLRPAAGRALRVTAFGLGVLVTGVGPVLLMPQHFTSGYVGLAAFGMALAVTAPLTALPGRAGLVAPLVASLLVATVQLRLVLPRTLYAPELRLIDDTARGTAGWLRAIDAASAGRPELREVVMPENWATHLAFGRGEAHRIFLCASFRVRLVPDPRAEPPEPWRAVLLAPVIRGRAPTPIRPCPAAQPG